jgi:electron transfer flavoprotein alpha subunit
MKNAALIVAINSDPQAPIFNVAHYGIVGDAMDVLPAMTEAVRARKG